MATRRFRSGLPHSSVYSEIHNVKTSEIGIFSVNVCQGTNPVGSCVSIDKNNEAADTPCIFSSDCTKDERITEKAVRLFLLDIGNCTYQMIIAGQCPCSEFNFYKIDFFLNFCVK